MKQLGSVQMKRNDVPTAMENRVGTNAHLPPLVGTVGKGRTGTASQRNFPVIPETVRHETGEARFFGRVLRPHRRSQCHGCQQ